MFIIIIMIIGIIVITIIIIIIFAERVLVKEGRLGVINFKWSEERSRPSWLQLGAVGIDHSHHHSLSTSLSSESSFSSSSSSSPSSSSKLYEKWPIILIDISSSLSGIWSTNSLQLHYFQPHYHHCYQKEIHRSEIPNGHKKIHCGQSGKYKRGNGWRSKNIARIANAVQVTICLLVSTSVY